MREERGEVWQRMKTHLSLKKSLHPILTFKTKDPGGDVSEWNSSFWAAHQSFFFFFQELDIYTGNLTEEANLLEKIQSVQLLLRALLVLQC